MKKIISGLIFAILLVGIFYAVYTEMASGEKADSDNAPPFSLKDTDGREVSLNDYEENILVLNFWATYCQPCKEELPLFESAFQNYREQGVRMAAVNVNEPEKFVDAFLAKTNLTFPVLLDRYGEVTELYGVKTLPVTYLIGNDGRILKEIQGELSEATLEMYIEKAINKKL